MVMSLPRNLHACVGTWTTASQSIIYLSHQYLKMIKGTKNYNMGHPMGTNSQEACLLFIPVTCNHKGT